MGRRRPDDLRRRVDYNLGNASSLAAPSKRELLQ